MEHHIITITHHNTASAAMKLILALQMNWYTRRRSSRPSLTSLTRRLQKCLATKLTWDTHETFSGLLRLLQLRKPSTFSLHVFREDTCSNLSSGKGEEECFPAGKQQLSIVLPPYLTLAWSSPCWMIKCICCVLVCEILSLFPPFCKEFLPNSIPPLPSLTTANFWRLFLFSCFFQRGSDAF